MPWVADGLIFLGSIVMTMGVIGMVRLPGVFLKQHAASKAVFLGVFSFLVAVMASGGPAIIARAGLIGLLLVLTTPVAAHEIAKAAVREERAGPELNATLPGPESFDRVSGIGPTARRAENAPPAS
jgi:multicomponent Na+:H+ antiporter subunit G